MKKLFLLSLLPLLFSFSWVELDTDESLFLKQSLKLEDTVGRSITLREGDVYKLTERYLLVLNAWLYRFEKEQCDEPNREVDLVLVPHERDSYEFGVNVEEGCVLNIFLLTEELNRLSIFKPVL